MIGCKRTKLKVIAKQAIDILVMTFGMAMMLSLVVLPPTIALFFLGTTVAMAKLAFWMEVSAIFISVLAILTLCAIDRTLFG